MKRNYYHKVAYSNSDVDLFLYGLETEEQANKKLIEIYETICDAVPDTVICFRSRYAVSIVSQFPYRHIQIILRLYKSPAEILMGFDVDACSIGYDGTNVWMTPRCHRSLAHQYNTVDMTRRSPTYEQRLAKYATRGFSVLVPTLQRDRIDPQLFERRFDQVQGLAKLLLLEKLGDPETRQRFKLLKKMRRMRPLNDWDAQLQHKDPNEMGGSDASDYRYFFQK